LLELVQLRCCKDCLC